jgi:putative membrane protein
MKTTGAAAAIANENNRMTYRKFRERTIVPVCSGEAHCDNRAMAEFSQQDPRVYFAAERTLLAWVRTGLAMMGFGFVVARFGLFLREIEATRPAAAQPHQFRLSLWFGTALVLMGVASNILSALHYRKRVNDLRRGVWRIDPLTQAGTVIAFALALVGVAVAVYLLAMH